MKIGRPSSLPFALLLALPLSTGCDSSSSDTPDAAATEAAQATPPEMDEPDEPADPETTSVVGPAGLYAIEPLSFDVQPAGCRVGEVPPWTWELQDPSQPTWTLVERVELDGHGEEQPYTCTRDGNAFACELQTGFDYNTVGQDANVHLAVRYDGTWQDAQTLSADYEVAFTCEGQQCDAVASQWTVTGFPCENTGEVRGVRQ
jgi:hypothetical protein